jgi:hypothetical protein
LHQRVFLFVNLFSQGNDTIVDPLELGVHIAVELDNAAPVVCSMAEYETNLTCSIKLVVE